MKVLQVVWKMHEKKVSIHYLCMENHKKEQLYMVMDHWKMLPFSLSLKNIDKDVAARQIYGKLWEAIEK